MAFKGQIQMDFIADLEAAGIPAVGLSGQDAGLIKGRRRPPVEVDGETVDYGLVGDVAGVDPALLRHLLAGRLRARWWPRSAPPRTARCSTPTPTPWRPKWPRP